MKKIATIICASLLTVSVSAQTHTEKITKELTFEKKGPQNTVMIFNIRGDVKVSGYAGDKILVEVEKIIRAKTDSRLESGKTDIQLGITDRADTIMLYMESPCQSFGHQPRKHNKRLNGW